MSVNSIKQDIQSIQVKIDELKEKIREKIKSLPENTRIKKISSNICIVKSSDLGACWSPEYHMFSKQYELILQQLEEKSLEKILSKLRTMINSGHVVAKDQIYNSRKYSQPLHPQVIEYLKEILGE